MAGPSDSPPPPLLLQDDPSAAEEARLHLYPKRHFPRIPITTFWIGRKSRARRKVTDHSRALVKQHVEESPGRSHIRDISDFEPSEDQLVKLSGHPIYEGGALEEDYDKDVYRWAILYENQRGLTLFSTAYYSHLSLLPIDPPPFTIPSTAIALPGHQPSVSLSSYPLPDGNWRWVSRTWMVDMRGDGQTQWDGFEYNWFFRNGRWRAEVGPLSAGGLVRRRRWVRLMMRPARNGKNKAEGVTSATSTPSTASGKWNAIEAGTTRLLSATATALEKGDHIEVWRGDAEDWARCHRALRELRTDGLQLRLWRQWLGIESNGHTPSESQNDKGKARELREKSLDGGPSPDSVQGDLTDDAGVSTEPAPKGYIASVVRDHGSEILQLFVFPDSRAHFIDALTQAGIVSELYANLGVSKSTQALEFWSYSTNHLENISNLVASDSDG